MREIKIAPSILSADFCCLKKEVKSIRNADYLHLDVMDGNFVKNISFGMPVIKNIRKISGMIFDVHLMISRPDRYIKEFILSGADIISLHYEASENIKRDLEIINGLNKKSCIAIKPGTEARKILDLEILDKVDMILVMTVEPGFGGQKMILEMLEKIYEIKNFLVRKGINIDIEADGGINFDNAGEIIKAGANVIVMGSAIFNLDFNMREEKIKEFCDIYK